MGIFVLFMLKRLFTFRWIMADSIKMSRQMNEERSAKVKKKFFPVGYVLLLKYSQFPKGR